MHTLYWSHPKATRTMHDNHMEVVGHTQHGGTHLHTCRQMGIAWEEAMDSVRDHGCPILRMELEELRPVLETDALSLKIPVVDHERTRASVIFSGWSQHSQLHCWLGNRKGLQPVENLLQFFLKLQF